MAIRIATEEIEEGMVLAREVLTPDGNPLLGAGTELTGRHRSLLEHHRVKAVQVVAPEESSVRSEPVEPEFPEVQERLTEVFSEVRGNRLMEMLLELARERAAKIQNQLGN